MRNKKVFLVVAITFVLVVSIFLLQINKNTESSQSLTNETQDKTEADKEKTFFMFVQNATSGTMLPVESKENIYLLTLNNVNPSTIYFSDRPERITGQVSMQEFLDGLGFAEDNPPNAAIEIMNNEGTADVLVVELFSPKYDTETKVLTYEVTILKDTTTGGLAHYNEKKSVDVITSFDAVALFIDDCSDTTSMCGIPQYSEGYKFIGNMKVGTCWNWSSFMCVPCKYLDNPDSHYVDTEYDKECNKKFEKCDGKCVSQI